MKENTCEISIRIHEENNLYHPLDPDQKLLSDVISYLQKKYGDDSQFGKRMMIQIT